MTPPTTRITASDAPTAMPAMAPTLRPSSSFVSGAAGGGGDTAIAPTPEVGVLT